MFGARGREIGGGLGGTDNLRAAETEFAGDFFDVIRRNVCRNRPDGLFPDTPGGAQSRVFFRRLFELADPAGPRLTLLTVGGQRIAAGIHFETADGYLMYNAGVDPDARDFSPGVLLLERLVRRAIERGKCRVDLLRGDEPYKYEWGAVDEPIQRLLVRRATS